MLVYKFFACDIESKIDKKEKNVQRIEQLFKDCKLYFSDWEKMNDPLEGYFQYYVSKNSNTHINDIKTEKNKYGITCCSQSMSEILMWSHYANNHKGICIEIEVNDSLIKESSIIQEYISYEEKIDLLEIDKYPIDVINLLSKKLRNWEYEKEIRFFCNGKNSSHKIGNITKVITGINTPDKVKDWFQKILPDTISLHETTFDFEINEVKIK